MDTVLDLLILTAFGAVAWAAFDRSRILAGGFALLGLAKLIKMIGIWLPREEFESSSGRIYSSASDSALFLFERGGYLGYAGIGLVVVGGLVLYAKRGGTVNLLDRSADLNSLTIPKNATNSFTTAVVLRDELFERFQKVCSAEEIEVVNYVSPAHSAQIWMRIEFVLPQDTPTLSLRAIATVEVQRFDFHRFEHVYTLKLQLGARTRIIKGIIGLDEEEIRNICRYLKGAEDLSLVFAKRVRSLPFQLWRPRNRVERLRPDWISLAAYGGAALLFLLPYVGWVLALAAVVGIAAYNRRQKLYILTTGKPEFDPRTLSLVDSWQTSVEGLGGQVEVVRDAIMSRLLDSHNKDSKIATEHIWYSGADGKVEREQMVVAFRRSLAYIHVEAYDDNLYVGWDTHLNKATWVEKSLEKGIDKESQKRIVANRVEAGILSANEYDVSDVNFLTEWVHSCVIKELKLKIKEKEIDQEIDFTITRESRQKALAQNAQPGQGRLEKILSRLRRVG